ncbi:MAG: hypothetical protein M1817_004518 [Caeruleum heppii]|nr:MAG: hypothetical protein M1817_004518 [Caeruleum heppii]
MPKILSQTPAWLSRPSPGFNLFSSAAPTPSSTPAVKLEHPPSSTKSPRDNVTVSKGPCRILARRGTEIFVVVDNQIRWADLTTVKRDWEETERHKRFRSHSRQQSARSGTEEPSDELDRYVYRTLKVPVHQPIQQLILSPNEAFLAIVTSHTVHIAVLPNPAHFDRPDNGPIRLKTYTLGPTTHVLSQSPVRSALWHPLGVSGNTLVTVTAEAVVRVWELTIGSTWSFDRPTLAIDLKKLIKSASLQDDIAPTGLGMNRGFSADLYQLEVAAASFGGSSARNENGWAPMTLWIVTRLGDVYALCPLLPARWQPSESLIPSLSVSIVSRFASMQDTSDVSDDERRACEQQYKWISELDTQEPSYLPGASEFHPTVEIYQRPDVPGPIPILQGPFDLDPPPDEGIEEILYTDIHVVGASMDREELNLEEDDEDEAPEGEHLSATVICIVGSNGRVHVCLDLDGVRGRWLPKKKTLSPPLSNDDLPSLVTFESIDTVRPSELGALEKAWPTFSTDPFSTYSLFVTLPTGVTYLSFASWVERLEGEFRTPHNNGRDVRLAALIRGTGTFRERIFTTGGGRDGESPSELTACVAFRDSDLGYFLLTLGSSQPFAASLDIPRSDGLPSDSDPTNADHHVHTGEVQVPQPRPIYQPPSILWSQSPLPSFLSTHAHHRHRRSNTEEIKLSQATLGLMTEAHQLLSDWTHQLGGAAAELFRRCERLQSELREQIGRVREVATKVDDLVGARDDDETGPRGGEEGIQSRLRVATERQEALHDRFDRLRKRTASLGGRQLSDKERKWSGEVERLESALFSPETSEEETESENGEVKALPWHRYQELKTLSTQFLSQAHDILSSLPDSESDTNPNKENERPGSSASSKSMSVTKRMKVPSEIRRTKVEQAMKLLARESALVDAAKSRLERLSLGS